ncbi:MAG: hypothetical protein M1325_00695 [Actinobacteria bacterium]|nr:hypothetical protein [Actinomycetota bacterium]
MTVRRMPVRWVLLAVAAVFLAGGAAMVVLYPFHRAENGSGAMQPRGIVAEGEFQELRALPGGAAAVVSAAPQELGGEPFRTCEACHPDYLQKPAASGDLIFSHRTHLEQGVACATCHQPPLGHFDAPAPLMMTCLSCHQGETAPNDCANCHRKLDEIAPGLNEPVVHLNPDEKTRTSCAKCHDVKVWCEQCHGVEMPHPASWASAHGRVALTQSAICEKCHQSRDTTFCIRCHGLPSQHPPYWYSSHGDIAQRNQKACVRCHPDTPQFCNQCHHAGYAPTSQWLPSQHGSVVKTQGTTRCFVCHEQSFCERCHEKGRFVKE